MFYGNPDPLAEQSRINSRILEAKYPTGIRQAKPFGLSAGYLDSGAEIVKSALLSYRRIQRLNGILNP